MMRSDSHPQYVGLLADIQENPEDDAPRLILADWLEDQGEGERAEFIRVQIEAERLDVGDPRRLQLEDRADELLAGHREEWLGPAGEQTSRWVFRRGFVESAAIECERFLDCAEEMFRHWPLRHLRIQGRDGDYADTAGVRAVTSSPWLARLERLSVFCDASSLEADAVAALAGCPHLGNLSELDLNAHDPGAGIGAAGVRILAESPYLRNLTSLGLRWQKIGDDGCRILARSQLLARLRRLDLSALQEMTEEGLIALLSAPGAGLLKWLNVENITPGPAALETLLAWGERAKPTGLWLGTRHLESGQYLGRATWLDNLTEAGFHDPPLSLFTSAHLTTLSCGGPQFCAHLMEPGHFESLRFLDLCHSPVGAEGILTMTRAVRLRPTSINLWFSDVGDEGMKVLAGSPWLANLRKLNLRFSNLTTAGVKALASSPHAAGLRSLYLSGNEIGAAGIRALARSPYLRRLRELDLTGVGATDAAVAAVCKAFPYLRWLDLSSNNDMTAAVAGEVCPATWPLLDRLTLNCHFDDETCEQLRQRWGPRVEFVVQDEWV
jgi:uncharacterized protein (TIGR02996 family)